MSNSLKASKLMIDELVLEIEEFSERSFVDVVASVFKDFVI